MKRKKQQQSQTGQSEDLCSSKRGESPDGSKAIRQHVSYYVAAAVSLMTLVVYLPALSNGFVNLDDDVYVLDNLHIRSLDWTFFKWAFSDLSAGFWHPLTWISYAVDYALWGMNPMGFHLTAILLHAINTFLVVYLAVRLLEAANTPSNSKGTIEPSQLPFPQAKPAGNPSENKEGFQASRNDGVKTKRKLANDHLINATLRKGVIGNYLPSFLNNQGVLITAGVTGLLFGLHPLHVESVAWVSERKDLLCTLFFLLSIIAYTKFVASLGKKGNQEKNSSIHTPLMTDKWYFDKWYLLSLTLFVFALSAKTMAVSLPAVLLIIDRYPYRRIQSIRNFIPLVIEKIPFIVFSLLISIVSISAQKTIGAMASMATLPLSTRVLVAAKALVVYLWNMVLPLNLTPFYPYPENVYLLSIEYFSALSLIAGITAVCIFLARRRQACLSLWGYYVLTLLPVLGIVQIGSFSRADRFTYLPSLGPFLLLGLVAAWVSTNIQRAKTPEFTSKLVTIAAVIFLVVPLVYLTLSQIRIWKNSITLWNYTIEKQPLAVTPHGNLGNELLDRGRIDEAIEEFRKITLQLNPNDANAHYNLGRALKKKGLVKEAIIEYQEALRIDPNDTDTHYNLAICFAITGKTDEAIEQYQISKKSKRGSLESYISFEVELEKNGLVNEAAAIYKKVMSIAPDNADFHYALLNAYIKSGQIDRAIERYENMLRLKPKDALYRNILGAAYVRKGAYDEAIEQLKVAVRMDPSKPAYRKNLDIALRFQTLGQQMDVWSRDLQ